MSGRMTMSEPAQRLELFTGAGRRRTWSDDEKASIAAKRERPGTSTRRRPQSPTERSPARPPTTPRQSQALRQFAPHPGRAVHPVSVNGPATDATSERRE